jgi:phage shock protein E
MPEIGSRHVTRAAARIAALAGAAACLACVPGAAAEAPSIAPDALLALLGEPDAPLLLDVRTPAEFRGGHVPGAVNIPHTELPARLEAIEIGRERGVVVYCESGRRAAVATEALVNAGFPDVKHLEGDMAGWRASDRPVAR